MIAGGLLVLRWPRLALLHLPAAIWGAAVELLQFCCPLTLLENRLRQAAGQADYDDGFIEQYLIPLIYPSGLTPQVQVGLGMLVLLVNGAIYGRLLSRLPRR